MKSHCAQLAQLYQELKDIQELWNEHADIQDKKVLRFLFEKYNRRMDNFRLVTIKLSAGRTAVISKAWNNVISSVLDDCDDRWRGFNTLSAVELAKSHLVQLILEHSSLNDSPKQIIGDGFKFVPPQLQQFTLREYGPVHLKDIIFPEQIMAGDISLGTSDKLSRITFPSKVYGNFVAKLVTTCEKVVLPKYVGGYLNLKSLESLKGITIPDHVGGYVYVHNLPEEDLEWLRTHRPQFKLETDPRNRFL